MDRLSRIAARVAGAQVQLQGPFDKKSQPQYAVEVDLPFGLTGPIAKLLLESWGEDPQNLNAVQQIEIGPNPDVPIGYSVVKDDYRAGQVPPSWTSPGDQDEYELEVKLTHIGSYELSDVDRATLDKAGVNKLVLDKVYDDHAEKAALRARDTSD